MMRYKLVIAEKPSVAQSLAAVIGATARKDGYLEGNGWRVSWCVGHLAGLADADSYDPKYAKWRYDDLPILPEHWQMVVDKDKKKQFDILQPFVHLRGCLFENGGSKGIVKIPVAATRENIEINDLQFVGLCQTTSFLHQRCFTPATWRYNNGINEILEVLCQQSNLIFPVSKIQVIGNTSVNKWSLHSTIFYI